MNLLIRPFAESDRDAVVNLWHETGLYHPSNDPNKDINRKVKHSPDMFLVGYLDGYLVATVMVGYDGHRGWINYLGVRPSKQGLGIGKKMMARAEALLQVMDCPKINLQIRPTNTAAMQFYRSVGYDEESRLNLGKRLQID